jgi:hypothetical protein
MARATHTLPRRLTVGGHSLKSPRVLLALNCLRENEGEISPHLCALHATTDEWTVHAGNAMNPKRWQQITQIFQVALQRDASSRAAYLNEALCR